MATLSDKFTFFQTIFPVFFKITVTMHTYLTENKLFLTCSFKSFKNNFGRQAEKEPFICYQPVQSYYLGRKSWVLSFPHIEIYLKSYILVSIYFWGHRTLTDQNWAISKTAGQIRLKQILSFDVLAISFTKLLMLCFLSKFYPNYQSFMMFWPPTDFGPFCLAMYKKDRFLR